MEIIEYPNKNSLVEIYQKSTSIFAFVKKVDDDKYVQCTQYVKCRDFLNDVIRGILQKSPISIYGFKYNSEIDPVIDMENISLLYKDPKKDVELAVIKAIKIINYYESVIKENYSSYILVDKNTAIITGPKIWLRSQVLTSLYTLLFRLAELDFEVNNENIQNLKKVYEDFITEQKKEGLPISGDLSYLNRIYKNLDVFLANYKKVLKLDKNDYDPILLNKSISLHNFHNYTGIVTLLDEKSTLYADKTRIELFKKLVNGATVSVADKDIITIYGNSKSGNFYTDSYNPNKLEFAFITTVGNKRVICHSPVSCREQLIDKFRGLYNEDSEKYIPNKINMHKVDTNKLRLLVFVQGMGLDEARLHHHKRELFFAKKVINYYEKLVGIKPSLISTALCQEEGKCSNFAWLFTGSKDWLLSPILLSLYPLIIRAAKTYVQIEYANGNIENLPKNIDDKVIIDIWNTVKKHNIDKHSIGHENILFDKHSDIIKILAGAKTLFVFPQEKAFVTKNEYATYGRNVGSAAYTTCIGINALLKDKYVNKNLQKKIKQYLENN
ncbi:MAG: hypothetical protein M0P43_10080 [Arcobacteraceae bacterium]|nr:hypothetical protein [Arcobacteraceae bacterium]